MRVAGGGRWRRWRTGGAIKADCRAAWPLSTSPCPACSLLRRACTHAHVRLHRTEQGQPQPTQQIAERSGDGPPQPVGPTSPAAGSQRNVHGPMAGKVAEQYFNGGLQGDGSFVCHLCRAPAAHINLKQFEQLHWGPHLKDHLLQGGRGGWLQVQAPMHALAQAYSSSMRALAHAPAACGPL